MDPFHPGAPARVGRTLDYSIAVGKEKWMQRFLSVTLFVQFGLGFMRIVAGDKLGPLAHFLLCYCGYVASQDRKPSMFLSLCCLWGFVAFCELLLLANCLKNQATWHQFGNNWIDHWAISHASSPVVHQDHTDTSTSNLHSGSVLRAFPHLSDLLILIFAPLIDFICTVVTYKLYKLYEAAEVDREASSTLISLSTNPVIMEAEGWQQVPHEESFRNDFAPAAETIAPPISGHIGETSIENPCNNAEYHTSTSSPVEARISSPADIQRIFQSYLDEADGLLVAGGSAAVTIANGTNMSSPSFTWRDSIEHDGFTPNVADANSHQLSASLFQSVFNHREMDLNILSRRLTQEAFTPFRGHSLRLKNLSSASSVCSTPISRPNRRSISLGKADQSSDSGDEIETSVAEVDSVQCLWVDQLLQRGTAGSLDSVTQDPSHVDR